MGQKFTITTSGTVAVPNDATVNVAIPGGGAVTIQPAAGQGVNELKINFANSGGAQGDVVNVNLSQFSQNGLQIDLKNFTSTDQLHLQGAAITGVNPANPSQMMFSYTGANGNTYTGYAALDGGATFGDAGAPLVICFAGGTLIETDCGEVPVEELQVGDKVRTLSGTFRPIRWIGARRLSNVSLALAPHLRPVRIRKGAFGAGLPHRDLVVSPQHRICLDTPWAEALFGEKRVLAAALHLVNDRTVAVAADLDEVTYYHLLFDGHEVLYSNGLPSESLHPGDVAMDALGEAARAEVLELFPELAGRGGARATALPVLKRFEADVLASYGL
ncbi:MAG: Hint domain-containing protein [Paracoccaceae bacterium]|nr:Hint domain-containing protein [Paracoccaceae bacterium]